MRPWLPDVVGSVERDGLQLGYEVYGEGAPTILLLPTWTIIHSRFWKFQIPYLARHYRVVTYDGPGNGMSDRSTDPARYAAHAYAEDADAVLDATGTKHAVAVGLSLGARYGIRLAEMFPRRISGLVLIGAALPLEPAAPERSPMVEAFVGPYPDKPEGWDKYNIAYWHDDYDDFVRFFFGEVFSEPHSTKAIEDAVGWSARAGADVLEAEARKPDGVLGRVSDRFGAVPEQLFDGVNCPVLVVQGNDDHVMPAEVGRATAEWSGATLVEVGGGGHIPNLRDPVRFNLVLRDFVERIAR